MEALIFPLVAFLVFFFFTEIVSFKLVYDNELIIDIDFLILGLRLYPQRSKKGEKNKKRKRKDEHEKKRFSILSFIVNIIPFSEVTLNNLFFKIKNQDISDYYIKKGIGLGVVGAFFTLLELEAKKFTAKNIFIESSDNNNNKFVFDIELSLPLSVLAKQTLLFIKSNNIMKRKIKTNVGSKNERYDKSLSGWG